MKSIWRCVAYQGVLLSGVLLFAGCHSTKTVFREPKFDGAMLKTGGLAVVAVTRPEEADYYAAPYIAERLETRLKTSWPELRVLPMQEVHQLLGEERHKALLEAFHERAVLKEESFKMLAPLASHVRYALLVDVRDDISDNRYSTWRNEIEEHERDPKTGECYVSRRETEYNAAWSFGRYVRALFIIYDLKTHQHMWIAYSSQSGSYMNSNTSTSGTPYVRQTAGVSPQELLEKISERLFRKIPTVAEIKKPPPARSDTARE